MARIIETATGAVDPTDVDPVTLDLIENSLRNARYEMDEVLFRTALSPGIREQHDEFPLIADPSGRWWSASSDCPSRTSSTASTAPSRRATSCSPRDPYACGAAISHANDWLVVMPIFVDGRVVGWASMFGHMSDVGGKTPCSMPTDARTIYEEGVVIPPFKLYAQGALNDDALRIILNQVRMPDWNRADLNGLVAACRTAGRRVREMCERFGTATYLSALDALLQRNHDAMKVLLQLVFEEGRTLSFTDYICDDGVGNGPYELKLSLTRTGEKVHLDFTGSLPAGGGAGQLLHQREPDPDVLRHLHDHGGRPADPVERRVLPADRRDDPGRLVLEAAAPGVAVRAATTASGGCSTCSAGLLGQTNPALLNAAGFSSSPHFMYSGHYTSGDRAGEWFQLYSIGFGGIPGRPLGDGPDGHSLWPSFVNIPCEYLESYYPLRIEKWETVTDTGGAGLHRGGNGVDVAYVFEEPGDDRHPRRPLADLPVGGQRRHARRPRHQVDRARGGRPRRCCRPSATTCRWPPATCCTS